MAGTVIILCKHYRGLCLLEPTPRICRALLNQKCDRKEYKHIWNKEELEEIDNNITP